jgi:hypothetical protein
MRKINKSETPVKEINRLYQELLELEQNYYQKALRLGELLVIEKGKLKHGEWIPWIEANLTFSWATAKRYIQIYRKDNSNSARASYLDETEKPKSQREALGQSAKQRKPRERQLTDREIKTQERKGDRILVWNKVKGRLIPILDEIMEELDPNELVDLEFAIGDYITKKFLNKS